MTGNRNGPGPGTPEPRERVKLTGALVPIGPLELSADEVRQLWSFIHCDIMDGSMRRLLRDSLRLCPRHTSAYAVVEIELWPAGAGARAGHQPFDVTVLYEDLLERFADGLDRKGSLLHRHPDEVLIAAARAGCSARPAHQTPSEGGPLMEPATRDTTATGRPSVRRRKWTGSPSTLGRPRRKTRSPGHSAKRARRHVHLHPGFVLVVVTGGVAGALVRFGLSTVLPATGGWPLPTLIINLTGAFLLGVLLEALVRGGPDTRRLRVIRLLAGTGFMGAFTTYSTLALETNTLLGAGRSTDALVYAATLIGGPLELDRHRRSCRPRPGKPPMRPASHRTTPTNQARERQ